ncbi:protein of unknown function [Nitratireductor aquimarinus]
MTTDVLARIVGTEGEVGLLSGLFALNWSEGDR